MRYLHPLLLLCCSYSLLLSGCRTPPTISQRINDFWQCRLEEKAFRDEQRRIEREAHRQEQLLEREALLAELHDEKQRLRAELRAEREALKPRYSEKVSTQLAFNLDQRFEVGQLQVNAEELKKLLEQREKEHAEMTKVYEHLETERKHQLREQLLAEAREALNQGDEARAQAALQACVCGPVPPPDCAVPLREKLQEREALRQPIKRPILPTEIPMMLPVTLAVEMERPNIVETRVQRQPLRAPEALKECEPACCPKCKPCGKCATCNPTCRACRPCQRCVTVQERNPAPAAEPPPPPPE